MPGPQFHFHCSSHRRKDCYFAISFTTPMTTLIMTPSAASSMHGKRSIGSESAIVSRPVLLGTEISRPLYSELHGRQQNYQHELHDTDDE